MRESREQILSFDHTVTRCANHALKLDPLLSLPIQVDPAV